MNYANAPAIHECLRTYREKEGKQRKVIDLQAGWLAEHDKSRGISTTGVARVWFLTLTIFMKKKTRKKLPELRHHINENRHIALFPENHFITTQNDTKTTVNQLLRQQCSPAEETESLIFSKKHYFQNSWRTNFYHTRGITPHRATSGRAHLRGLAAGQYSSEETSQRLRAVADSACVQYGWTGNWSLDFPHRKRYLQQLHSK